MFGFQCDNAGKCSTGAAETARLQDKLTGALIGLARATDGNEHLISDSSTAVIVEALFATLPNSNLDNGALEGLLTRVEEEKRKMVPDCFICASPCGRNNAYDMNNLRSAQEDVRSLRSLILLGIRGMAAYACHAAALGCREESVDRFFYKGLIAVGMDDFSKEELLPIVMELGEANLKCMVMLERACTEEDLSVTPG